MDPSPVHTTPSTEEDEWDTDGFVIPSLGISNPDQKKSDSPGVADPNVSVKAKKDDYIYLGPHGAPPSHTRQQEQNSSSRKQRFKQKLKEADGRFGGTGREDKVDNLRELVGGKMPVNPSKSSSRDWLDPHCHESQFERKHL
ncbi:unnamed protein product [Coffea canephora]|uniref:Uncharacterized protein n=1 Tax=Coffea canephora TaxID=49390 RepID=A0A068V1I8_COFCA|nr:unnamed protein product [Coffea canephora]